jgi:hypothetical protein
MLMSGKLQSQRGHNFVSLLSNSNWRIVAVRRTRRMFDRLIFKFSEELSAITFTVLAFVFGWALLAGYL